MDDRSASGGVLAAFARHTVFANIMILLILVAGLLAAALMIREMFPQFSLDRISVSVAYPGADPEEVEEGICSKIEEAVEDIPGISEYTTSSSENIGSAVIEVDEDFDMQEVLDKVRSRIDAISTFPEDAESPIISEIVNRSMVVQLALSGAMSERRLKEWAEAIRDEVLQLPEVSQANVTGARAYEVHIEISEPELRRYGLTLAQVAAAVRSSNLNLAGGTIRTANEEIRVRTVGRRYTGDELAGIVVLARPSGEIVTLGRIADIRDAFAEDPLSTMVDGRPAVFVSVMRTEEEDAIVISDAVHRFVARKQDALPPGAHLAVLFDQSDPVRARIRLLVKNGAIGLVLVFLLLWLFLDLRLSFWVGMGMPISLGGGLVILWAAGGSLNMISLFGLIMVLGIIVDDAIVVGESVFARYQQGEDPFRAAVAGVREVAYPVVAAVATTVVAFLPLAYVGGIMGKFIGVLPVVVIACLSVSLVECLLLLPAHLGDLPPLDEAMRKRGRRGVHRFTAAGLEWFIEKVYTGLLGRILRWRYTAIAAGAAIVMLTFGLFLGGMIKYFMFPDLDSHVMWAAVEFPEGTPADVTERAVRHLDQTMVAIAGEVATRSGDPALEHRIALVGQAVMSTATGPHIGASQAILVGAEDRETPSDVIMTRWEEAVGDIPGVESLTFNKFAPGPGGADIEVWLQGHDMAAIRSASEALMARLRQFDGVSQVRSDFRPGKNELRLRLKPHAAALGLTVQDLATQVYAGYFGQEAVRLQRGRDDVRVRVRYPLADRKRLSRLADVRIRTPQGAEVPLFSVADTESGPGYSTIVRTNGMRRVAVSAKVNKARANAEEIVTELESGFLPELRRSHPGLYLALRGERKDSSETMASLLIGFPLALLGIYVIVATIFRSYLQPWIILTTVPMGFVGALWGHLLMGYNLSLMSVFGMVALAGVVVNDAIVLMECINANLAAGADLFRAIQLAGARRFRAVFLTTVSTVGGLLPMLLEQDMQAQFLIPMAVSIAAGVACATLLTLVLIPCLVAVLNDFRCLASWIRTGRFPEKRRDVEPAAGRNRHHQPALPDADVRAVEAAGL